MWTANSDGVCLLWKEPRVPFDTREAFTSILTGVVVSTWSFIIFGFAADFFFDFKC